MVKLTSSMVLVPYLLVAAYGFLIARRGDTAFMIYAGGIKFLLLSTIPYAFGTVLYFQTRREQEKLLFEPRERLIFAVVGCLIGIYSLATEYITV
ncbi:hypothetical protein PPNSA23_28210 [Phyllobacterium phragmitis]|uniref:Uncharacterized protein n=1 Tax=Phyllobacterium phragmitis TaxID=2670329 RepID=A0ABQ0H1Q9_9HYPH